MWKFLLTLQSTNLGIFMDSIDKHMAYEIFKAVLIDLDLDSDDYELAIKLIAQELEI